MNFLKKHRVYIALAVVAAVAAAVLVLSGNNKYNREDIPNPSGKTISQIAEQRGITLAQLKEEYALPKDMRGDTFESCAYYYIPASKMAELQGVTFDDFAKLYGWGEDILPDTPWGEAQDKTSLKYMYDGDKALRSFCEQYNLGDNITGDTKYGEVRHKIKDISDFSNLR